MKAQLVPWVRTGKVFSCLLTLVIIFLFLLFADLHTSLSATAANTGGIWQVECVDCPHRIDEMGDHSLRLDAEGHPHIAYGGDALYYAYDDGSGWQVVTVDDTPGWGDYTSLALDQDGYAHITYAADGILYAYQDASGWHFRRIAYSGYESSIAVDQAGYPHIAYTEGTLKYTYQDGSGWHTEEIYSGGGVSLVLDDTDVPHVAFKYGENLFYAFREAAGVWQVTQVTSATMVGYDCSLALDSKGRAHISQHDLLLDTLVYSYQDEAGVWHSDTIDAEGEVGYHTSIAIDQNDYPHISYYDYSYSYLLGGLKYAYQDAGGWHFVAVKTTEEGGAWTSLALDENDQVHISYYDNADVVYAYQDGDSWQFETVDVGGQPGMYTSLAFDDNDYAHISYYDWEKYDLKFAYQDAGGWHIETLDAEGTVGQDTDLVLDADDYAHIAYIRGGNYNGELR